MYRLHNSRRRAISLFELIVACGVLFTGISLVSTGAFQVARMTQACRRYQLAQDEVANQIEMLVHLKADELVDVIGRLEVSEQVQATLDKPVMSAALIDDEDGKRVFAKLFWKEGESTITVSLMGWVVQPHEAELVLIDAPIKEVSP